MTYLSLTMNPKFGVSPNARYAAWGIVSRASGTLPPRWLETDPKVDGIVSDVMMPGGTGIEFVHLLRSTGRTTPVLLVSGFALEVLDDVLSADHTVAFLPKPWALDALMSGIEGIIHNDTPDQPTLA
jgi:two-component system, cell cycle sensor histidine kinase and response regulator CckA